MPELLACITDVYLVACKKGVTIFFFAFFRRAEPSAIARVTHVVPLPSSVTRARLKNAKKTACSAGYLISRAWSARREEKSELRSEGPCAISANRPFIYYNYSATVCCFLSQIGNIVIETSLRLQTLNQKGTTKTEDSGSCSDINSSRESATDPFIWDRDRTDRAWIRPKGQWRGIYTCFPWTSPPFDSLRASFRERGGGGEGGGGEKRAIAPSPPPPPLPAENLLAGYPFDLNSDNFSLSIIMKTRRKNILRDQRLDFRWPDLFPMSEYQFPLQGTARTAQMAIKLQYGTTHQCYSWK